MTPITLTLLRGVVALLLAVPFAFAGNARGGVPAATSFLDAKADGAQQGPAAAR